jgi:hypothetical protein
MNVSVNFREHGRGRKVVFTVDFKPTISICFRASPLLLALAEKEGRANSDICDQYKQNQGIHQALLEEAMIVMIACDEGN